MLDILEPARSSMNDGKGKQSKICELHANRASLRHYAHICGAFRVGMCALSSGR